MRIFSRERKSGAEEASYIILAISSESSHWRFLCSSSLLKKYVDRQRQGNEQQLTSIQLHIIRNHQHNFPLKDVAIDQPTAYPGNVLIGLHVLELAGEHPACGGGGHFACVGDRVGVSVFGLYGALARFSCKCE